jgi:hypothetical protein
MLKPSRFLPKSLLGCDDFAPLHILHQAMYLLVVIKV